MMMVVVVGLKGSRSCQSTVLAICSSCSPHTLRVGSLGSGRQSSPLSELLFYSLCLFFCFHSLSGTEGRG